MLPRVFDRFFRGDPATTTRWRAAGLGLSIAQWIVTAHMGAIQVTSSPSESTRVVACTLPRGDLAGTDNLLPIPKPSAILNQ